MPDPLKYDHTHDPERTVGLRAEVIASPSAALREIVAKEWKVPESSILHLPYPYRPSQVLLDVPADTSTSRVTYIGRLEGRKGVVELAEAIPRVIRTFPGTTFRFIGRSLPSPTPGLGMRDYLVRRLRRFRDAVEFVDQVEITDIPHYLRDTDICVFPSRWENFPNVCLEAMSSARGVVGSREGGMREMLDDGHYGEVVDPRSPEDIARGLSALLGDRQRRIALGEAARERVLAEYGGDALGARYEACYRSAVAKRHEAIPCPV